MTKTGGYEFITIPTNMLETVGEYYVEVSEDIDLQFVSDTGDRSRISCSTNIPGRDSLPLGDILYELHLVK